MLFSKRDLKFVKKLALTAVESENSVKVTMKLSTLGATTKHALETCHFETKTASENNIP